MFLTAFEQWECSEDGGCFLALIVNSAWIAMDLMQP